MAGTFRRKLTSFAAEIGLSETDYLAKLRSGSEWCSRHDSGVGAWIESSHMATNTTRLCKACQAAQHKQRYAERKKTGT